MVDGRSLSSSNSIELPTRRPSWWRFLLPLVWAGLAARLGAAFARNEPFEQDFLSLALVAFFMTTALLGSQIWVWLHDRWEQLGARRSHAT
jgi:hypothetical protein